MNIDEYNATYLLAILQAKLDYVKKKMIEEEKVEFFNETLSDKYTYLQLQHNELIRRMEIIYKSCHFEDNFTDTFFKEDTFLKLNLISQKLSENNYDLSCLDVNFTRLISFYLASYQEAVKMSYDEVINSYDQTLENLNEINMQKKM